MRYLRDLGHDLHEDSRRWFAAIHERGLKDVIVHYALGLGGETGEVLDVIKKVDICGHLREQCEYHSPQKHSTETLASELADAVTYLLALAYVSGIDLDQALEAKRQVNRERWGDPSRIEPGGSA